MGKYTSDESDAFSDIDNLFDANNIEVVEGISPENLIGKQFPVAGVPGANATIKYAPSAMNSVETHDVVRPDGTCKLTDNKDVLQGLASGTHLFPTAMVDGKGMQPVQLVQKSGTPNPDNVMVATFNSGDALKIAEIMAHLDERRRTSSTPPAAVEQEMHKNLLEASRKGIDSVKDYFTRAEVTAFKSIGMVLPKKAADNLASKFRRKAKAAKRPADEAPPAKRQRTLVPPAEAKPAAPPPAAARPACPTKWTLTIEGNDAGQLTKFAELLGKK